MKKNIALFLLVISFGSATNAGRKNPTKKGRRRQEHERLKEVSNILADKKFEKARKEKEKHRALLKQFRKNNEN